MKKRAILVVIDSLGVGAMEDIIESRPQDEGANTFYHIIDKAKKIEIPVLEMLGINKILNHDSLLDINPAGSFGKLNLMHFGADSYAGHQEIMGTKPLKPLMTPFKTFIEDVKSALEKEGYKAEYKDDNNSFLIVNNLVIIADNIETDYGQIYNVSAPLDYISFEEVLRIGKIVRANVKVNRVIALGGHDIKFEDIINSIEEREDGLVGVNSPKSGVYNSGYHVRHLGYGVNPENQISEILIEGKKNVSLIGKMQDVISCDKANKIPAVETDKVMELVIDQMSKVDEGLIAATVQETDLSGHAQDVDRYARKIMVVDKYLDEIIAKMCDEDLLIVTADHGNDPTIGHSQHTREKTMLLVYGKKLKSINLGERESLSDIAATIADYFNVRKPENGESFYSLIRKYD